MIKKCSEHAKGKTCFRVIAEGKCQREKCKLFNKVLRMIPKFKRLYELEAQGAMVTTVWNFSEKNMKRIEKRKKKAKKWLEEFYPRIQQNLQNLEGIG